MASLYPIIHKRCGQVAFYRTRQIQVGDLFKAGDFLTVNHKPMFAGELMVCGSCGYTIRDPTRDMDWTAAKPKP